MVIMPQLNLITMINQDTAKKLIDCLVETFPKSTVRNSFTHVENGSVVSLSTPEIDTYALTKLAHITGETNASVIIKRSGTGLSIIFS